MSESSSYSNGQSIRVQLDTDILQELIYGSDADEQGRSGDTLGRSTNAPAPCANIKCTASCARW